MNKYIAVTIAAAILGIGLSVSAQAGKKAGYTAPLPDLPRSQVADLTSQECRNLGGAVKDDNVCRSGRTCKIENANGDVHRVCLEVAN